MGNLQELDIRYLGCSLRLLVAALNHALTTRWMEYWKVLPTGSFPEVAGRR